MLTYDKDSMDLTSTNLIGWSYKLNHGLTVQGLTECNFNHEVTNVSLKFLPIRSTLVKEENELNFWKKSCEFYILISIEVL